MSHASLVRRDRDRLLPADPSTRSVARALYERVAAALWERCTEMSAFR